MIIIVDYGMGNLGSILNMLKKIGAEARISSNPVEIGNADKLILPGVGSFDSGMKNLTEMNITPVLYEKVINRKTPFLGICLGMQLFTKKSEEGVLPGLGWIDAETKRFSFDSEQRLKIPHMGWNMITVKKESPLFKEMYLEPKYYFVHSYHVICNDPNDILTTTYYGYDFVSSVQRGNIFGVQFHPEKSHKYGMKLLNNFVDYKSCHN